MTALAELPKALNELNSAIQMAESALNSLGLHLRVPIRIAEDELLVWGKFNNAWRLLYERADHDTVILVNAPKEVRLRAVHFIPELPARAEEVAREQIQQTNDAVAMLNEFVMSIPTGTK